MTTAIISFIVGFASGIFFGIFIIALLDISKDRTKGDKDE